MSILRTIWRALHAARSLETVLYYSGKLVATAKTAWVFTKRGKLLEPGVIRLSGSVQEGPVLFDFSNTELVHLGDQLFNLHVVRHLASRGVDVWVDTPNLPNLFASVGAKAGAPQQKPRLVVSKNDVAYLVHLRFPESTFLGLGYGGMQSHARMAWDISRVVLAELGSLGTADDVDYRTPVAFSPDGGAWREKLAAIEPGKGILAWNAYIASGQIQGSHRTQLVVDKARELASEGYRIVQLGSRAERELGPTPDFVSLDLRGEVSPEATFAFLREPHVAGTVSFDNFLVHATSLVGKPSWVVFRYENRIEEFRARYIPFFESSEELVAWWR